MTWLGFNLSTPCQDPARRKGSKGCSAFNGAGSIWLLRCSADGATLAQDTRPLGMNSWGPIYMAHRFACDVAECVACHFLLYVAWADSAQAPLIAAPPLICFVPSSQQLNAVTAVQLLLQLLLPFGLL